MDSQKNDLILHLENLADLVRDKDVHVEIREDEDNFLMFSFPFSLDWKASTRKL